MLHDPLRTFSVFILLSIGLVASAQPLDYYPERKPGVSTADYDFARMVLEETYQKVKQDGGQFTYADYWNLALAFKKMDQEVAIVREYLFKSRDLDPRKFREIFVKIGGSAASWQKYLSKAEHAALQRASPANTPAEPPLPDRPASNYDAQLLEKIRQIDADDQRHRSLPSGNLAAQRRLDAENLQKIDALYRRYGRYLGRDLVGEQYDHVMWAVIQHSDPATMERYLPVVYNAVQERQLSATMFKMLLDRLHALRYGYQLFGSQVGVPLAEKATIERVRKLYQLD